MIDNRNCCGCTACFSICPVKAIQMDQNDEGFYVPKVDPKKCIRCGKCQLVCPLTHPNLNLCSKPDCYAIYNKNEQVRANSSSGGAFSLLAEEILNKGGYVCGATYSNEKFCHHIIIDNINDLAKLRGSKYIQSNVGDTYEQTKKLLDKGKWFLYSGTPCQIAGLKNYLGKDYDNLITVDLVCHGTPSPKAWEGYLKDNFPNEEIQFVNFRDKSHGWKHFSLKIKTDTKECTNALNNDLFMKGFLSNIYLNDSCYSCPFHKTQRPGDITLGDFWGYNTVEPKFDDDKGMSIILFNSMKGHSFFNKIKLELYYTKKYPLENVVPYNQTLAYPPLQSYNKKLFFYLMNDVGFNKAFERLTNPQKNVAVFNMFWGYNYGGVLTAYALQTILLHLGYNPCLIRNTYGNYPQNLSNPFCQFEQENLFSTKAIRHPNEMKSLNRFYDKFIVGSDQVWRFGYVKDDYKTYFLSFVASVKNKIACAASFGQNYWKSPPKITKEVSNYLQDFDAISVREKSGVDICKDVFGVKAQAIFDPVFFLKRTDWKKLLDKSKLNLNSSALVYILDKNGKLLNQINGILKKQNMSPSFIKPFMSIYDFLKSIQSAQKIITDSFHGVCFSIIFQKDFICLCNKNRGEDRFVSLLSDLGLMDRLFYDLDGVDFDKLTPIDYKKVNSIIEQKRQEGVGWLTKVLDPKKFPSKRILEDEYINKIFFFDLDMTIDKIVHEKISISRFGDGEIKLIKGISLGFQRSSPEISKRLNEVLISRIPKIEIALPSAFFCKDETILKYWRHFKKHFKIQIPLEKKGYIDAFITTYDERRSDKYFIKMRQIWDKRDVHLIHGKGIFDGFEYNIFDNAKSVTHQIAPNKDAFEKYDEILSEALKVDKDKLIIIILGPTATILAYDLALKGYQALDMGHIAKAYDWYKKGKSPSINFYQPD